MRRPYRILRLITRLNIGGPATHVTVADAGLRDRGWETLLAFGSVEAGELEIDLAGLDLPIARIPGLHRAIRPRDDLRAAAAIAGLIRRFRPDVIHTHLSKAGLLGRALAVATSRAVRVHTFHGNVFGGYFGSGATSAVVASERLLGAITDVVVAISASQAEELIAYRIAPRRRIAVVPLGLPLERFIAVRSLDARAMARARLDISADEIVTVAVGRLVAVKRMDRLIDAFAEVARAEPRARLYLVGDGPERPGLEARVVAAGASGQILFAGWSLDPSVWYAAADVVALTSDREGTPLALIEAAAAGRPVVCTDVGGVRDIVDDGRSGFVVAPDSLPDLVDRLRLLVREPDTRGRMGEAATQRAGRYAASRLVDDLDELYRTALRARGRS